MTKATPKKKTTTTKKKPTVKAHRGFAHVPLRGRRRPPIQRRPVGDPPRRRPMTPTQRDALRRQQELARRRFNQQSTIRTNRGLRARLRQGNLTPAQRKTLEEAMRRGELGGRGGSISPYQRQQLALARRRQLEGTFTTTRGLGDRKPRLPIQKRPTVEQLRDARRIRRPVGDPKPRKRPTTPKQKQRVVQATQTPRTRRRRRPV
jgi:hypothetical protein